MLFHPYTCTHHIVYICARTHTQQSTTGMCTHMRTHTHTHKHPTLSMHCACLSIVFGGDDCSSTSQQPFAKPPPSASSQHTHRHSLYSHVLGGKVHASGHADWRVLWRKERDSTRKRHRGNLIRGRSAEENSDWLRTYQVLQLFREIRAFFARSDQEVP